MVKHEVGVCVVSSWVCGSHLHLSLFKYYLDHGVHQEISPPPVQTTAEGGEHSRVILPLKNRFNVLTLVIKFKACFTTAWNQSEKSDLYLSSALERFLISS